MRFIEILNIKDMDKKYVDERGVDCIPSFLKKENPLTDQPVISVHIKTLKVKQR